MNSLESSLSPSERHLLQKLKTPFAIQNFLDEIPYPSGSTYHCPLQAIRRRKAHCFDGALLAAALLRRLGYPPLIVYTIVDDDDDHLLAPFKKSGHWGALAKSNYVGLRFREPIYRSLRELVMSYFEQFFNLHRKKSLRSYTAPLNLSQYDSEDWMIRNGPLEKIADRLDDQRVIRLVTPQMVRNLSPVDEKSYRSGLLGANPHGIYRPEKE